MEVVDGSEDDSAVAVLPDASADNGTTMADETTVADDGETDKEPVDNCSKSVPNGIESCEDVRVGAAVPDYDGSKQRLDSTADPEKGEDEENPTDDGKSKPVEKPRSSSLERLSTLRNRTRGAKDADVSNSKDSTNTVDGNVGVDDGGPKPCATEAPGRVESVTGPEESDRVNSVNDEEIPTDDGKSKPVEKARSSSLERLSTLRNRTRSTNDAAVSISKDGRHNTEETLGVNDSGATPDTAEAPETVTNLNPENYPVNDGENPTDDGKSKPVEKARSSSLERISTLRNRTRITNDATVSISKDNTSNKEETLGANDSVATPDTAEAPGHVESVTGPEESGRVDSVNSGEIPTDDGKVKPVGKTRKSSSERISTLRNRRRITKDADNTESNSRDGRNNTDESFDANDDSVIDTEAPERVEADARPEVDRDDCATDGEIQDSDVTRSRYGRVHKKRSISPTSEALLLEQYYKKYAAKDAAPKDLSLSSDGKTSSAAAEGGDDSVPCRWQVGDIVWARLTGFPWWPGLLGMDPLLNVYTTVQVRGKHNKLFRKYHVQFLGSAVVRRWMSETSLMPFEGKEKYKEQKNAILESSPRCERARIVSWYEARPSHRVAWLESIAEAELALPLNREERMLKFGVDYFDDNERPKNRRKSKSLKRRHSSPISRPARKDDVSTASPRSEALPKKRRASTESIMATINAVASFDYPIPGFDNLVATIDDLASLDQLEPGSENSHVGDGASQAGPSLRKPKETPQRVQRVNAVSQGNYAAFLQRHKQEVKEEHPDQPDELIENFLRKQWSAMSDEVRGKYRAAGGPTPKAASSGSPRRRQRAYKPSQKLLEADMDSLYDTPPAEKRRRKSILHSNGIPTNSSKERRRLRNRRSSNGGARDNEGIFLEPNEDSSTSGVSKVAEMSVDSSAENTSAPPSVSGVPRHNGENRQDKICSVCEGGSEVSTELVKCGVCYSYFHMSCISLDRLTLEGFKCEECTTGVHSCFVCKEKDGNVRRCTVSHHCGHFYHEGCAKKFFVARVDGKSLTCPLHACVVCAANNPKNPWAGKGKLIRCIRCPTAYHNTDSCIGAGTAVLSQGCMICPQHYSAPRSQREKQRHQNVNWCFLCSTGGSLICCESCPAAFHVECLGIDSPEGSYYCPDCSVGRQPKYGDIVWVKLGQYRWWPAEVRHFRSVPDNIQAIDHSVGEFPVRFFGSHDYYWTNRSRVFLYQEGDKGVRDPKKCKGLAKVFQKALQEAQECFEALKAVRASREAQEEERLNQRPPPYRQLKINKPFGKVQVHTVDEQDLTPCECDPMAAAPCNSDTECLNRMLMVECHPAVCAAGDKCHNQRFQLRQYNSTVPFKTAGRGWGLKATTDIKKGDFVIEYVGEVIDEEECRQRMRDMHQQHFTDFYFLTIDKDRIIDAGPKGNLARYMNHSCQPNCETQKWTVHGDTRVGLFAIDDISAGTELTFNYNLDCLGNDKSRCCCGAPNCSGYIGVRPKTAYEKRKHSSLKKPIKKRRRLRHDRRDKSEHEDDCFRCGEGGELVMCDKKSCTKAYHLACLSLDKLPRGHWVCPWHHCDICGRPADMLCSVCPNSFCKEHQNEKITRKLQGVMHCYEHDSQAMAALEVELVPNEDAQNEPPSDVQPPSGDAPEPPAEDAALAEPSVVAERPVSIKQLLLPRRRKRAAVSGLKSSSSTPQPESASVSLDGDATVSAVVADETPSKSAARWPRRCKADKPDLSEDTTTSSSTTTTSSTKVSDGKETSDSEATKNGGENAQQGVPRVNGVISEQAEDDEEELGDDDDDIHPDACSATSDSGTPSRQSPERRRRLRLSRSSRTKNSVRTPQRHSSLRQRVNLGSGRCTRQRTAYGRLIQSRQEALALNGILSPTNSPSPSRRKRLNCSADDSNSGVPVNGAAPAVGEAQDAAREEALDETTAIITVENLEGIGGLGLKPYVQKYKLENGELSLEECEEPVADKCPL